MSVNWEDSTTYQLILSKRAARAEARGRIVEARLFVLTLGEQRFGAAPPTVEELVHDIADCERLERIALRISSASDWNDLLSTP